MFAKPKLSRKLQNVAQTADRQICEKLCENLLSVESLGRSSILKNCKNSQKIRFFMKDQEF